MAVEQIDIEKFLGLSNKFPVLDVRSPGEFSHAHIPGALALPLFTDEQRKIIGTAYKQESRQIAVDIGLQYFSCRMQTIAAQTEEMIKPWIGEVEGRSSKNIPLLVHCWRGGMRSGAVAWLLNLYGFKVYTLRGGYKSFRNWVLSQFEKEYRLSIVGGYTGSGKTDLLHEMRKKGQFVVDLERLANHKGSAFGSMGEQPQPGQEMFENLLAMSLYECETTNSESNGGGYPSETKEVWLEDESRHIGTVGIPNKFWDQMRRSPLYFLDIPFDERLKKIIGTYGNFDRDQLINATKRIEKRLGGLETKKAIQYLEADNITESFSILLKYYDKLYSNSLLKRENLGEVLNKIAFPTVDIRNAEMFCNQKHGRL